MRLLAPTLAAAAMATMISPAAAVSGAELLSASKEFGTGYVWSTLETSLLVGNNTAEEVASVVQRSECIQRANLRSDGLYEATIARIRQTPKNLALPAQASVLQVVAAMCDDTAK